VLPASIDTNLASRFGYICTLFAGLKKAHVGPGKTLLIDSVTGTLQYSAVTITLAGLRYTEILGIGRIREGSDSRR